MAYNADLRISLRRLDKAWIDAQFARMADDASYQELQLQIDQEFEIADWEAFQPGEKPSRSLANLHFPDLALHIQEYQ
jgi:hypothetical protein